MPFTDYQNKKLLDTIFGANSYIAPTTLYVGLSTTTPVQTQGSGTPHWNFTEPSGGSYVRSAITNNIANFPAASWSSPNASKSNGTTITFAQATSSWGTITYMGIWDALTGGNLLWYSPLGSSQPINSGATATFASGGITIQND